MPSHSLLTVCGVSDGSGFVDEAELVVMMTRLETECDVKLPGNLNQAARAALAKYSSMTDKVSGAKLLTFGDVSAMMCARPWSR